MTTICSLMSARRSLRQSQTAKAKTCTLISTALGNAAVGSERTAIKPKQHTTSLKTHGMVSHYSMHREKRSARQQDGVASPKCRMRQSTGMTYKLTTILRSDVS